MWVMAVVRVSCTQTLERVLTHLCTAPENQVCVGWRGLQPDSLGLAMRATPPVRSPWLDSWLLSVLWCSRFVRFVGAEREG